MASGVASGVGVAAGVGVESGGVSGVGVGVTVAVEVGVGVGVAVAPPFATNSASSGEMFLISMTMLESVLVLASSPVRLTTVAIVWASSVTDVSASLFVSSLYVPAVSVFGRM